uniref:Uncharacterized protein n=1 Tax=Timema douglasi TaxID=61478 RepID=A0A7R8VTP5_TIMDO|nr:unnamed protein product [Timema douglasi]
MSISTKEAMGLLYQGTYKKRRVESYLRSVCEVVCLREEVMAMCAGDSPTDQRYVFLLIRDLVVRRVVVMPLLLFDATATLNLPEVCCLCLKRRSPNARSDAEWENVWHNERHTRCRANLLKHLYWACEKDIYRLSRRNDQHNHVALPPYPPGSPFVSVVEARVFLRSRRDRKRRSAAGGSITDECCQASGGCTWEEYAEYCPANKRLRKFL